MPHMKPCQAQAYWQLHSTSACQEMAHGQVAERGLKFVQGFARLLAMRQATGQLPTMYREAWSFSACMTLAGTAAHMAPPPPTPVAPPTGSNAMTPLSLTASWRIHRCAVRPLACSAPPLQPQRRLCCGMPCGPALAWCRLRPGRCMPTAALKHPQGDLAGSGLVVLVTHCRCTLPMACSAPASRVPWQQTCAPVKRPAGLTPGGCRRSTSEFTQRGPMGGSLGGINDPNTRIMGLPRSLSTGQLLEGSHEGLVSLATASEHQCSFGRTARNGTVELRTCKLWLLCKPSHQPQADLAAEAGASSASSHRFIELQR